MKKKIVIIGGGPAGLAAAISAYDCGEHDILLLERDSMLGGILNQCIHNGFGLHIFKEELTGPEYAYKYIQAIQERNIECFLDTMVIEITSEKQIVAVSKNKGLLIIEAEVIILACGARERPRGALNIAGTRPAGVYTAGTAQRLINIEGYLPGRKIVILGSGDIGLIMARRLTWEGADVKGVFELMPYSGGLNRNIVQCLEDYNIPLYFSHTVIDIKGKDRVKRVTVAPVDKNLRPIFEQSWEIGCDTLLLSVGLIPENELAVLAEVTLSPLTGGAVVDEAMMTSVPGIFAGGNVLHIHDLVDYVSDEAALAGKEAVRYLRQEKYDFNYSQVIPGYGIRYVIPQKIKCDEDIRPVAIRFRADNIYHRPTVILIADGKELIRRRKMIATPGEMEVIMLDEAMVQLIKRGRDLTVSLAVE